jgi:hypothetical protein
MSKFKAPIYITELGCCDPDTSNAMDCRICIDQFNCDYKEWEETDDSTNDK